MNKAFSLARWPLDVCLFELALGYGVSRILKVCFEPDTIPWLVALSAYAMVAFVSAYAVCRYMPSDAALERNGHSSLIAVAWTSLSLGLAVATPVISVFYSETVVFWLAMVLLAALKALYSLEVNCHRENVAQSVDFQRPMVANLKGFRQRFIYSPAPDAFALQPGATAILLTMISLGSVLTFQLGGVRPLLLQLIGVAISGVSTWLYIDLSTASRINALERWASGRRGRNPPALNGNGTGPPVPSMR